jgi:hypothetical protein
VKVTDLSSPRALHRMTDGERYRATEVLARAIEVSRNRIAWEAATALTDAIVLLVRHMQTPASALRDVITVLETALEANYGASS